MYLSSCEGLPSTTSTQSDQKANVYLQPRTPKKIDIDSIALEQIQIRNRLNFRPKDEWKIFQVIIQD